MRTPLILLSATMALAVAAPAVANRPQDAKDQTRERTEFLCESGDTIAIDADLLMWPPNHKYQALAVTAEDTDGDGDNIELVTSATHDEYVEGFTPTDESSDEEQTANEEQGAGNTADDARPFGDMDTQTGGATATTNHELRSERSGRGDGRTYTISATAMFDEDQCDATFEILVPHDMRSDKAPAKKDQTSKGQPNS